MTSCTPAAAFEQAGVFGQAEQLVHHRAAVAQILDGLEQRHDVDVERAVARPQQPGFLQQHGGLEDVGDAGRLGDHVVRHRVPAVAAMRLAAARRIASSPAVSSE